MTHPRRNRTHFAATSSAVLLAIMCSVAAWGHLSHKSAAVTRHLIAQNSTNITVCSIEKDPQTVCKCGSAETQCIKSQCVEASLSPMHSGEPGTCLKDWEMSGGIIVYIACMVYLFIALAIICDDYFCDSLELISETLELSDDVAGATFMAIGSSAPELFVSFADNVLSSPPKSLGVGTVVGSAIFNILVIVGLSGSMAYETLQLDWRPLARDCTWYIISIGLLVFAVYDGKVSTAESTILVVAYIFYILTCAKYQSIVEYLAKRKGSYTEAEKEAVDETSVEIEMQENRANDVSEQNDMPGNTPMGSYFEDLTWPTDPDDQNNVNSGICGNWRSLWKERLWYIISLPLNILFRLTVPDCGTEYFNGKVGMSACFFMSIVWIAVISHLLTFCCGKFSALVGISVPVAGLTIMAAGTSVPDALASVIEARKGKGDMAVANSIGSNVFDILVGLGLPYLISTGFVYKTPAVVQVDDLTVSIVFLFGVVFVMLAAFKVANWGLGKTVGFGLIILYVIYVIFALAIQPFL